MNRHHFFIFTGIVIGFWHFWNIHAQAQPVKNTSQVTVTDTLEYAFLPAFGYSSDVGLIGGGIISRYHYKEGVRPFYSYLTIDAAVSTKGLISASVFYDKPYFFRPDQRLSTELYISRFLKDQFYGVGNYSDLVPSISEDQDYYYFESFSIGFESIFRKSLTGNRNNINSDIYLVAEIDYHDPLNIQSGSYFYNQQPVGANHSGTIGFGGGYIFDNRNSEFDPGRGMYAKAGIRFLKDYTVSSEIFTLIESEIRTYQSFYLIRSITFANRISYQRLTGDAPFWIMPVIGGEETMRGYPKRRFVDNNALLLNSELRTWLFEFPEYEVKFGGTLFFDIGRTFANNTSIDSVFDDLRYTYGLGGTSSFFNDNFIFRADLGFSEDGYGLYFTAGYLF